MQTAHLVHLFKGSRVVALDIAGDEGGYPIGPHIPAYRCAIDNGIHRTAHAGEARGPDSVWETLEHFKPSRIGHGVRSIEDPVLMSHLRDTRIHLEVCPSSNVQTRTAPGYAEHCVDRLYRAGISLGISTDARTITNVTLEQEYSRLRDHSSWTDEELTACNRAALRAAFIDEDSKSRIQQKLEAPASKAPENLAEDTVL
jgi:adenosine deaminase